MTKQISILLVDDDPDDVFLFEEVLKKIDPSVNFTTASDGEQALAQLAALETNNLPHLIFLDLNMPRMDGRECLKKLKQNHSLSAIPVIMYSTSSQVKDMEDLLATGAICYITKPSNFSDLNYILKTIVDALPGHLNQAIEQINSKNNLATRQK